METKRFSKNDSGFICRNCGASVMPLGYSSRDHCPFCLYSLHVDNLPGDRASECGGTLVPVSAQADAKKGYIITYRCRTCNAVRRCRAAHEAKQQPDDINLIIKLTVADLSDGAGKPS